MIDSCMTSGCFGKAAPANGRGLCMKCYSTAKRAVENGKTTWEKMEELGLVGRKADPFEEALKKAMEGNAGETTT